MKPRLFWLLLSSFLLVIVLGICGIVGFVTMTTRTFAAPDPFGVDGLPSLNTTASDLGRYYQTNHDSWDGVATYIEQTPSGSSPFVEYALVDSKGNILASTLPEPYTPSAQQLHFGVPVIVDGAKIATVVPAPRMPATAMRNTLRVFMRNLLIVAGAFTGLLVLLAIGVAHWFSKPLQALTAGAQALSAGRLDVQVPAARVRELDELSGAFNSMARSLAAADQQRRQMTADIAHELRTPLSIIKGRLEGIQDGVYTPDDAQIEQLLDKTTLLERLIDDLRVLALAEAGQLPLYPDVIEPARMLDQARSAFADRAARQHVAVQVEVGDDLPTVQADPQRMQQVLHNLVSNALRYTPPGGTITLSARSHDHGVEFAVRDTGQGIPSDDLPHIFDRFWRGDRARTRESGGSGLGLAITRQIVLAHGGTISVASANGHGTTITFIVPGTVATPAPHQRLR